MQHRFGLSAIDVFALAASEGKALGCKSIGSELILLALLRQGRSAVIFRRLELDCERACAFVKATVLTNANVNQNEGGSTSEDLNFDEITFSSDAKKVLLAARSETLLFSRDIVLEEHLLLGILRESDTVAGALLKQMKIDLKQLREDTQRSAMNNDETGELNSPLAELAKLAAGAGDSAADSSHSMPSTPAAKSMPSSSAHPSKSARIENARAPNAVRLETDTFSSDSVQLLATTQRLALQMGASSVEIEHLFYAALSQETLIKYELLACGAANGELEAFSLTANSQPKNKAPEAAVQLRRTIEHSMEVATLCQSFQVEPEHLFISMSDLKFTPSSLVYFPHFDMAAFHRAIIKMVEEKRARTSASIAYEVPEPKPGPTRSLVAIKSQNLSEDLLFERLDQAGLDALREASEQAALAKQELIGSEHLLTALLLTPSPVRTLLRGQALNVKLLQTQLAKLLSLSVAEQTPLHLAEIPSGGAYPLLDVTDLPVELRTDGRVLNGDCLHIFNLAAQFADLASTRIDALDLFMGLLASRAGVGFELLSMLKLNLAELYRNCYKLKNSP